MSVTNGNGTSNDHHSDVCIIGGGPTGLILAINLAQSGMKVTVFEANASFSTSFRAVGHIPPVFPEFAKARILEKTKKASAATSGRITFRRTTDHKVIDTIEPMPGRPGPMVFPQSKLSGIMVERLEELHVELLMGHQCTGFEDRGSKDGVTVTVEDTATNTTKTYVCKYLVGADGSKSFVRRALGLSYTGTTLPFKLVAADLFYPFERFGWDGANFMLDATDFGNIALVDTVDDQTLWRVGIGFPISMSNDAVLAALPDKYRAMFPRDPDHGGLEWRHYTTPTPYEAHHLCAPRFRHGNVFLIGDAAHIANPFSGQVLACGIFDASSLADCIVAVEQRGRPEVLFDEWSDDRVLKFKTVLDPLARACFEAVSHPDVEGVGGRHPFLMAKRKAAAAAAAAASGKGMGPAMAPPSLVTRVEGLRSWGEA